MTNCSVRSKKYQCCWLPGEPKVLVQMLSLDPVPSIPHTIIELSGIAASGNEAFPPPGTKLYLFQMLEHQ